jgi:hypothetical protein
MNAKKLAILVILFLFVVLSSLYYLDNGSLSVDESNEVDKKEAIEMIEGFEHQNYEEPYNVDIEILEMDYDYYKYNDSSHFIVTNEGYRTETFIKNDKAHYLVRNEELDTGNIHWSDKIDSSNNKREIRTSIDELGQMINKSSRVEVDGDKIITEIRNRRAVLQLNEDGYIKRVRGVWSYNSSKINNKERPSWIESTTEIDDTTVSNDALNIEKSPSEYRLVGIETKDFPDSILYTSCGVLIGIEAEESLVGHVGQSYSIERKCKDVRFAGVYEGGIIEFYNK